MTSKRFGSQRSFNKLSFEAEERESAGRRGKEVEPVDTGGGSYDPEEIEKRRKRQAKMDKNNTDEGEELAQDSVNNVIAALSRKEWFPWVGEVYQEEDRLGDADWKDKADVWVEISPEAMATWGLPDIIRVSVKSGWFEVNEALNSHNCKELLHLTPKRWRELELVLLLGQMEDPSIAVSFLMQVANYRGIYTSEAKWFSFIKRQPAALQSAVLGFRAKNLDYDWERLLYWVQGKNVERSGKSLTHFVQ